MSSSDVDEKTDMFPSTVSVHVDMTQILLTTGPLMSEIEIMDPSDLYKPLV